MIVVLLVYLIVGLGVFLGRRDAGDGAVKAMGIAVAWPVLGMIALGRNIA